MIELIKSMEELIHKEKSHWTTKYVVISKLRMNHNELSYRIKET